MLNSDIFFGNAREKSFVDLTQYEAVTISFDSGGSGGGAFFMGFVSELAKHPNFISHLKLVTGVSAGGYAAYFLATGRTKEAYRFWRQVCLISNVIKHGGMQSNLQILTRELLGRFSPTTLLPLKIFTKLMPSTAPTSERPSIIDRISSRFGFKVKEFVYWMIGINNHDYQFCFDSTQTATAETDKYKVNSLLEKVLIGGARFLPILMGPAIKISNSEAASIGEKCGGIVHDYGIMTMLGGLEDIVPNFSQVKTLHFVIVGQHSDEYFWNSLRRAKIKKLIRHTTSTVMLIHSCEPLPRGLCGVPNWLSIKQKNLDVSRAIGVETARAFIHHFVK